MGVDEWARSVAGELDVPQHLQPVGMRAAVEQFCRTFSRSLGSLAAEEAAVVEEELEQRQIIRSQVAAEGRSSCATGC